MSATTYNQGELEVALHLFADEFNDMAPLAHIHSLQNA